MSITLAALKRHSIHISLCNIARLVCCTNESSVGGQFSIGLFNFVNRYFRHSFTVNTGQVLTYINTTNCSRIRISNYEGLSLYGIDPNVSVAFGNKDHARHANFFAYPANCEIVAHPLKACQKGNALAKHFFVNT